MRDVKLTVPDAEELLTQRFEVNVHFAEGRFAEFQTYTDLLKSHGWEVELKAGERDRYPFARCQQGDAVRIDVYGPRFDRAEELPPVEVEAMIADHVRRQTEEG
jgi:hypothetical protein